MNKKGIFIQPGIHFTDCNNSYLVGLNTTNIITFTSTINYPTHTSPSSYDLHRQYMNNNPFGYLMFDLWSVTRYMSYYLFYINSRIIYLVFSPEDNSNGCHLIHFSKEKLFNTRVYYEQIFFLMIM